MASCKLRTNLPGVDEERADIRVVVRTKNRTPYAHSKAVRLASLDHLDRPVIRLESASNSLGERYYFFALVPAGKYRLSVDSSLASEDFREIDIEVAPPGRTYTMYADLTATDLQASQALVGQVTKERLVAVASDGYLDQGKVARFEALLKNNGITVQSVDKEYKLPRNIRLYRVINGTASFAQIRKIVATELARENYSIEIGAPIASEPPTGLEVVGVLTNEFVIRLPDNQDTLAGMLLEQQPNGFPRRLRHAKSAWLIKIDRDDYQEAANILRKLQEENRIRYWEANYYGQVIPHSFPQSADMPHFYIEGENLKLQGVEAAWRLAEKAKRKTVCVATIDVEGSVNPEHVSVKRNLKFSYDFAHKQIPLPPTRDESSSDHGMGVFGIISGTLEPGSAKCVGGIAAEASHIALWFPGKDAVTFSEILLWLTNLSYGKTWKEENGLNGMDLNLAADVISLSFHEEAPISETLSDTLQFLLKSGRSGKGTVIVCSAGNGGFPITWLAEDPRTIAVTNTMLSDGLETDAKSNIGFGVDICAQGDGCMSLTKTGIGAFTGTSAAAPMVAGAAALMLSVNPELTARQVRDILRSTADAVAGRDSSDETSRAKGKWRRDPFASTWVDYCEAFEDHPRQYSPIYGYGRLNVEAAVTMALDLADGG
jgi:hypothetical protein